MAERIEIRTVQNVIDLKDNPSYIINEGETLTLQNMFFVNDDDITIGRLFIDEDFKTNVVRDATNIIFKDSEIQSKCKIFENATYIKSIQFINTNFKPYYDDSDYSFSFNNAFSGCSSLENVSFDPEIDGRYVKDMTFMFSSNKIKEIDLTWLSNADKLQAAMNVFNKAAVETIILPETFSAPNMGSIQSAFNSTQIRYLTLSSTIDIPNAYSCGNLCQKCSKLRTVTFPMSITCDKLYTFSKAFDQCYVLRNIEMSDDLELNCTSVSQGLSFNETFNNCRTLKEFKFPRINCSKGISNVSSMFNNCVKLKTLDMTNISFNSTGLIASNFLKSTNSLSKVIMKKNDYNVSTNSIKIEDDEIDIYTFEKTPTNTYIEGDNIRIEFPFEKLNITNNSVLVSALNDVTYYTIDDGRLYLVNCIFASGSEATFNDASIRQKIEGMGVTGIRIIFEDCEFYCGPNLFKETNYISSIIFGEGCKLRFNTEDEGLTWSGDYLFYNCENLLHVSFDLADIHGLTSAESMFEGSGMTQFDSPYYENPGEYLTSVNNVKRMFYNCQSIINIDLTWIELSASVTEAENIAELIDNCNNVISIYIREDDYDTETNKIAGLYDIPYTVESVESYDTGYEIRVLHSPDRMIINNNDDLIAAIQDPNYYTNDGEWGTFTNCEFSLVSSATFNNGGVQESLGSITKLIFDDVVFYCNTELFMNSNITAIKFTSNTNLSFNNTTGNAVNLSGLFKYMSALKSVDLSELTGWDKFTKLDYLFQGSENIEEIKFPTTSHRCSKLLSMQATFENLKSVNTIDLSFITELSPEFSYLDDAFRTCYANIIKLPNTNVQTNAQYISCRQMFSFTTAENIDLSSIIIHPNNLSGMFADSNVKTLNLTGIRFDRTNEDDMNGFLSDANELTQITMNSSYYNPETNSIKGGENYEDVYFIPRYVVEYNYVAQNVVITLRDTPQMEINDNNDLLLAINDPYYHEIEYDTIYDEETETEIKIARKITFKSCTFTRNSTASFKSNEIKSALGTITQLCFDNTVKLYIPANTLFSKCDYITDIWLQSTDMKFGYNDEGEWNMDYAFEDCTSLNSVSFEFNNNYTKLVSANGMYQRCTSLTIWQSSLYWIKFATNIKSAHNIVNGCTSIEEIVLPEIAQGSALIFNELTDIHDFCHGCSNLKRFVFPDAGLTCHNLTDVSYFFYGCDKLESVTPPSNITGGLSITNVTGMFEGCESLELYSVSSLSESPIIKMTDMFYGCHNLESLDITNLNMDDIVQYSEIKNFEQDTDKLEAIKMKKEYYNQSNQSVKGIYKFSKNVTNVEENDSTVMIYFGNTRRKEIANKEDLLDAISDTKYCTKEDTIITFNMCLFSENEEYPTFNDADIKETLGEAYNLVFDDVVFTGKSDKLFNGADYITSVTFTDNVLMNFNNENQITMEKLFKNCGLLSEVIFGENIDLSQVTNAKEMFMNSGITTFTFPDMTNTEINDISSMFNGCSDLTDLDMSMLSLDYVNDMSNFLDNADNLTTLILPSEYYDEESNAIYNTRTSYHIPLKAKSVVHEGDLVKITLSTPVPPTPPQPIHIDPSKIQKAGVLNILRIRLAELRKKLTYTVNPLEKAIIIKEIRKLVHDIEMYINYA